MALLMRESLENSTKKQQDGLVDDFLDFCDRFGRDPHQATPRIVQEYICYLFKFTEVTHGAADKRLTAPGYFWESHRCDWDRKRCPTVARMLKGFRRLKP